MITVPDHMPPRPPYIEDRDELHEFWTTYPNSWDIEYMEWRQRIEDFARELRAWWWDQQNQLVPVDEYKDGQLEFKWDGELLAVSKPFYTWLNKSDYAKSETAPRVLVASIVERAKYAAEAKAKK